jgi:hypothetical protein
MPTGNEDPVLYEALTAKEENYQRRREQEARFKEYVPPVRYRWYPIDCRLPDDDIVVLTYTPTHSEPVWLSYYDGQDWHYVDGDRHTPSHWMELPEQPTGE